MKVTAVKAKAGLAALGAASGVSAFGSHPARLLPGNIVAPNNVLSSRQASANILDINSYMASSYKNGSTAPGARAQDAAGQYVVIDDSLGADDNSQVPHCDTIFIGSAAVAGSDDGGWQALPNILGFDLMRDVKVDGDTVLPYFMEHGKDPSKVKRIIFAQPGKPRDSWKYSNLIRNSLICAAGNKTMGVDLSTILVVAPAWLNENDAKAGAAQANDLYWPGSSWASGALASGPGSANPSSFHAFDVLINSFFSNKSYSSLNNVFVAGHSLGGTFTQRYAMLRTPNENDPNIAFWTGNCGAYVWPTSTRPVMNNGTCPGQFDEWPYGVNDTDPKNIPAYARKGFDKQETLNTYFGRQVHYNLGLLDNGPGDTHCEAQYQGPTHLTRGVNLQATLAQIPAASGHTFDYVANTSHQDYKMFSSVAAQQRLFVNGIDTKNALASTSAKGKGKGSSSSNSSKSSAAKVVVVSAGLVTAGLTVAAASLL
ncbi:hypothetical protein K437DRAFT_253638 [Tilletiaria anomala UBC 951]|uniref:Alpha/beta-hydrolase n=1 Tax=Tilletiaria anomala (strain ATCC 24038 / CBS 436.72 / UBC 951) TaxID=1037660 RepID=A0A066WG92_TILAU|nr:uncharacterized protein K437DRAFT_253638 [Tilletiaria anomala UBC 951]KDN52987.1 hypothetical protein K437DRAFT_253638 [Tilletiaria anomala UBC 951]